MIDQKTWKRLKRQADAELEAYGIQPTEKRLAGIVAAMDPGTRHKFLQMIGVISQSEKPSNKLPDDRRGVGADAQEAGHDAADR